MSVTQDAAARIYLPASAAEWTELLSGLSINNPGSAWRASQASGASLADLIGSRTVTITGSPTLGASAPGFTATGIKCTDGSATQYATFTGPDTNTTSSMLLQVFALNTAATAARGLNRLGDGQAEHATLQSGNKLRATSGVSTADGVQQQAGVMVVVTKFDRANSVLGVYTKWEQIRPTYTAPGGLSTTFYLLGNASAASDATLVYGALWTGSDAEISDSKINDLLEAVHGAETTIEKMAAGSFAHKWVAAIEGCPYLLSDASSAAVLSAYAGRDWTQVLGGLFVEMANSQSVTPFEPFTSTGRCTLRIVGEADGTDTLGKFIARRAGGDETTLTASIDRNDTTIPVKSTQQFASSGTVYIGTEAIAYTGITASSFTGCTRGLYSPAGTALSGTGGVRFGNDHRVGTDSNYVQMNPVVSSLPRVWIGKRVTVQLHTWDAANGTINSRAEAQTVFAGRVAGISDDHNNVGTTVIELDHAMMDFANTTIWKDPFYAEVSPGLSLIEGRTFSFWEGATGLPGWTANALTVVAGAPASTNELQAGTYSLSELCAGINGWLANEKLAGRLNGYNSFASPVSNNDGMRTVCHWYNDTAANAQVAWQFGMPSEVAGFLGVVTADPTQGGTQVIWKSKVGNDATQNVESTDGVPFTSLVFRPQAARFGQEFSGSAFIDLDNVNGAFFDQYANLPSIIKEACDSGNTGWGLFLFDEKVRVVATYDNTTKRISNIWVPPIDLAGSNDTAALGYWGRRADEPDRGPVKVRQILAIEDSFANALLKLAYSTGTTGYNHSTYDTYGSAIGVGMPGEWLGPEFELAVTNLPNADAPITLWLDEPTKFSELMGGDLNFRMAFIRWKDQHFEIAQWRTPLNGLAIATLSEENKAGQPGESHRVASQETNEHVRPVIKIDFCRDIASGRNGDYLRSFTFEDQTSVDDSGGSSSLITLKLRNTLQQHALAGASIEAGLADFMARMPCISRVSRKINRSLDHRYVEAIAPGDIVTVVDNFARDPLTGARGISSRAFFVTRVNYDLGGPNPSGQGVRPYTGEIEANSLDTQRGEFYAPSADIDDTAGSGGFSAGYNNATATIRCYANHYSHVITIPKSRGTIYLVEDADASHFEAGDQILIVERDPSNTASPTYWEREVLSVSGNDITLTSTISGPAWDVTKRYRVVPQLYSQTQASQHEACFQADDADEMIEDTEIPYHFSATDELYDYTDNTPAAPAEFVPDMCFGDGRPWDVGHDQAIARTLNAGIDYQSAHQAPFLKTSAMGPVDNTSATWACFFFAPIFLGTSSCTTTVTRLLSVAPWFRSSTGATGKVRVTIMEAPPVMALDPGYLPGECFRDSLINCKYSRTSEWSTTSTTWAQGDIATLSLGVKDIFFGFVYLLVEGTGFVECRGLSQVSEGPRSVL